MRSLSPASRLFGGFVSVTNIHLHISDARRRLATRGFIMLLLRDGGALSSYDDRVGLRCWAFKHFLLLDTHFLS